MKIGQMSISKLSNKADYLQLNACGMDANEVVAKYLAYEANLPVILHGDWTKKGFSENDILRSDRQDEYIEIVKELRKHTEVIGYTVHPPYRNKVAFDDFVAIVHRIESESGVPVFVENRSSSKIWLSNPQEIIAFSKVHEMTIDIPQLYISCGYDQDLLIDTLHSLTIENIKEVHFANIMRRDGRSFVGRKLDDGVLDLSKVIIPIKNVPYYTLEMLGGVPTFEVQASGLQSLIARVSEK